MYIIVATDNNLQWRRNGNSHPPSSTAFANLLTLDLLTVERRWMTVVSRGIATDDTVNDKLQVWL